MSQPNKSYIDKLNEPDVISVVNSNKVRFEPLGDLVNTALMDFRYGHHTDSFAEQENDDVEEKVDNTNLCDDEGEEEAVVFDSETPAPHNSTPSRIDLMPDVDINDLIQSLNVKQRQIFEVVNKWARSYVKSLSSEQRTDIQPLHIFITGGAGCGKSHLIRTIHASVSKTLSYRSAYTEKTKVLLLAPTGVAAININGNTIHSGLGIPVECQGLVVPKLSDKRRCTLRMQLSDVKVIIIDEISMVSNKLLLYVHQRLLDIFGCSTNHKLFAGITVILVGDLYQLPPVLQKPVYAEFYDQLYNIFPLWRNFQMCELTEVMRQRGDSILIDLLNNVRIGRLSLEDVVLLRSRFVKVTDPHYPTHALHIFAENAPAKQHNSLMLNEIDSPLISIDAIDQVPKGVPKHVYSKILMLSQSKTGGLSFNLTFKKGARVMLTSNIDISEKLINGQIGTVAHVSSHEGIVKKIYVKFDDRNAGHNRIDSDKFAREIDAVPLEKVTTNQNQGKKSVISCN